MGLLEGRRVLLGVGGGIAAYKAPELVRRMIDGGADVRVMLTAAGARFVSALSLEVVSGHPVGTDLWATREGGRIVHTDAGGEADLIVLAPATADLIGKIRHGLADDLLTTTVMASRTPVLVCPSMNTDMLENPIVRENMAALGALGRYALLEPDSGFLACRVIGPGRQPDPPVIIEAAANVLTPKALTGCRATVSAGPTREQLDPVRFLSNRSSGTMGFAIARTLAASGANVTLVAGPTGIRTPVGVATRVDVESAAEMEEAVFSAWPETDLLVMTAAVADYRPATRSAGKLKKGAGPMSLELERTTDILARTAAAPDRSAKVVVGFAAETGDAEEYARGKLEKKGLDWIVANDVSEPGVGFGPGENAGVMLGRDGSRVEIPRCSKDHFAARVVANLRPGLAAHLAEAPRA